MARLNQTIKCKKDGTTEEITVYTTLEEVSNKGIQIGVNGELAYMRYDVEGTEKESVLNCKIPNDSTTYKIIKEGIPLTSITLRCFDVETEQQISALVYPVPGNGVLYLNNENAPSIEGYDFVMTDGIKHTDVVEDDVFDVWYISQSVPDRTKTSWSQYFASTTDTTIVANTYSATSLESMCSYNANIAEVKRINTSNVTTMYRMFVACSNLTSVPQMDTSNVTNMYMMFYNCSSLTSVPQMDTSNVTNMYGMFSRCSNLTTVPQMDTSNVTDMQQMFYACSNLTSVPQMDTSNVTNMYMMFYNCSSLTSVPQMDTSNVTNMYGMFMSCSNLTSVPQMDTSNVTNMNMMFYNCSSLTSINWEIDMSSCTNCANMFYNCPATNIKLKNVPSTLDLSKIGTTNYTVVNYI